MRGTTAILLLTGAGLLSGLQRQAEAQGAVLIKEVISREVGIHVGGISDPDIKELVSREVSIFVESGRDNEVISREISIVLADPAPPPIIDNAVLTAKPDGATVFFDWTSYNQWAVRDVAHYEIYYSTSAFDDVSGMTPTHIVPGETQIWQIDNLPTFQDHFFAIVPVDALGNFESNIRYYGVYVLTKEIVSREVGLFVGAEPDPPYREVISREISINLSDPAPPPRITDFGVTPSPSGHTVSLDWSAYNQFAVRDVDHYDIYYSLAPFTSVTQAMLRASIPGETFGHTFTGLTAFVDHYFAVVPVDGLGNFESNVVYSAAYVLMPEVISREVGIFTGQYPPDPPPVLEAIAVSNHGFEQPITGNFIYWGSMSAQQQADFAWTASGNGANGPALFRNGSAWGFSTVPDGQQAVSLQGTSTIEIPVTVAEVGDYELAWYDASRSGQVNPYTIHLNGLVASPTYSTGNTSWQNRRHSIFISSPGTHTLSFAATNPGGGDNSVGIDDVTLTRFVSEGVRPLRDLREIVSREISIVVPDTNTPSMVTGTNSGFFADTSIQQYGALDLDWTSYNQWAERDIAQYRIYVSTSFFDNVTNEHVSLHDISATGLQTHTITNLDCEAIYYVAVTAEDALGNYSDEVYSFSQKTSVCSLGDVSNLVANARSTSIDYQWDLGGVGLNLAAFTKRFHIYLNGSTNEIVVPGTEQNWTVSGLMPGQTYTARVSTVDIFDFESPGISVVATTLGAYQPALYYDFEDGVAATVVNKGMTAIDGLLLNYDGSERGSGAPGGSTPGSGYVLNGQAGYGVADTISTEMLANDLGVRLPNSQPTTYTFSAWFKHEKPGAGDQMIFGQAGSVDWFHLGLRNTTPHHGLYGDDLGAGQLANPVSLPTNEWHHLVFSMDFPGGVQRTYLDGEILGLRAASPGIIKESQGILIGNAGNGDRGFQGQLDEIAVWTNALSAVQIRFLANGGSPTNLAAAATEDVFANGEFYTAPHGTNHTWNLYQVLGGEDGAWQSWYEGYLVSTNLDPVATNLPWHMVSVTSVGENEFLRQINSRYNGRINLGLTDNDSNSIGLVFPGAYESGTAALVPDINTRRNNGWVWTSGEPNTFNVFNNGEPNDVNGEDGIILLPNGNWNDTRSGIPGDTPATSLQMTVIEWDFETAGPIAGARLIDPVLPASSQLPGPEGVKDSFSAYWLDATPLHNNLREAVSNLVNGDGVATTFTNGIPVVNSYDPTRAQDIDIGLFPQNDPLVGSTGVAAENYVVLYRGWLRVREGQEGRWTFGARTDDGFALRIGGIPWVEDHGLGWIDHNDTSVLTYEYGTGNSDTRGEIDLPVGLHPIEFLVCQQGSGGNNHELFAAMGSYANEADTDIWRLIGHRDVGEALFAGIADTNLDGLGWTLWHSTPGGEATGNTNAAWLAVDDYVLNDLNNHRVGVLNFVDPGFGNANEIPTTNAFPWNTSGDDNTVAMFATAQLEIPADGTYRLGFKGDDGSWLRVVGQNWDRILSFNPGLNAANVYLEGERMVVNQGTGNSRCVGEITLAAGVYDLEFLWWEGTGGSYVGVFSESTNPAVVNLSGMVGASRSLATGDAQIWRDAPSLRLVGSNAPLDIAVADVEYDSETGALSLSWDSEPGGFYDVLYYDLSAGLHMRLAVWGVLREGIPAGSGTTTTISFPDFFGQPWGSDSSVYLFRIREQ